jgi:hypothetical protein
VTKLLASISAPTDFPVVVFANSLCGKIAHAQVVAPGAT